ncbi:hypothetical protein DSO57_1004039 [Entomophthora muscae]|uniref:Uncharacterized protein n=2 Tax=Entomophthora muscae TaxID=34485 RepID=A0ACC2U7S4_9FUNG|nr:hypothetical protein DSO57_1017214 [Entomophthora muscae]KAJ9082472.1 hypothetical protein DSO57_1004039 [Entomophthora muscae]
MMIFIALLTTFVLGQIKNASAAANTTALNMGSDCRAPTIFTACMERGQQMLDKCSGDVVCKCRFSKALSLCFEQCKTANPTQKQQIDASSDMACTKLNTDQRSAAYSPMAASSTSSSASPTGTTGISAKVNVTSRGNQTSSMSGESSSDASMVVYSPFLLAYAIYNAL